MWRQMRGIYTDKVGVIADNDNLKYSLSLSLCLSLSLSKDSLFFSKIRGKSKENYNTTHVGVYEEIRTGTAPGPPHHTPGHDRSVASAIRIVPRTLVLGDVIVDGTRT